MAINNACGFFGAGRRGGESLSILSIVRGVQVTFIDQVYRSLFNPDLVREALAGDPNGELRAAANVMNLEKVLDSGPAPTVAISSHPPGSQSDADLVNVEAGITN